MFVAVLLHIFLIKFFNCTPYKPLFQPSFNGRYMLTINDNDKGKRDEYKCM